jgi:acetyl esterase/lipase
MLSGIGAFSQQEFPLYDGKIPNSKPSPNLEDTTITPDSILIVGKVSRPTITAYFPPEGKANGEAIIICPGGGYSILASRHEGWDVAKRLNEMGITAFVLKYRIPNSAWMENPEIGPLQDAQRAIQFVREHAKQWKLNKKRIGMMGFSAGGHLASTAGTHFNKAYIPNKKKISLRPDFLVLVYPVISFSDSIGHTGSRDNLLGKDASKEKEKVEEYSNELHVTSKTPPAFLVHAKDDWVNYRNSVEFANALRQKGIYSEVLLYEVGGHGFGLTNKSSDIQWIERMREWLEKMP